MKCPICGDDSFVGPRCSHTPEEWAEWHLAALDAEFGPGSYVLVKPKDAPVTNGERADG